MTKADPACLLTFTTMNHADLQLLNNHCCVHTRTAFVDHEDPELKRHLLRMWVAPPQDKGAWPLPECFAQQYGSVTLGNRGGITIEGFEECIPLEAELPDVNGLYLDSGLEE